MLQANVSRLLEATVQSPPVLPPPLHTKQKIIEDSNILAVVYDGVVWIYNRERYGE